MLEPTALVVCGLAPGYFVWAKEAVEAAANIPKPCNRPHLLEPTAPVLYGTNDFVPGYFFLSKGSGQGGNMPNLLPSAPVYG